MLADGDEVEQARQRLASGSAAFLEPRLQHRDPAQRAAQTLEHRVGEVRGQRTQHALVGPFDDLTGPLAGVGVEPDRQLDSGADQPRGGEKRLVAIGSVMEHAHAVSEIEAGGERWAEDVALDDEGVG